MGGRGGCVTLGEGGSAVDSGSFVGGVSVTVVEAGVLGVSARHTDTMKPGVGGKVIGECMASRGMAWDRGTLKTYVATRDGESTAHYPVSFKPPKLVRRAEGTHKHRRCARSRPQRWLRLGIHGCRKRLK